ncbi:hypothetical protein SmJEL517_g02687 [Synchytrium microbalum]|uniref:Conserved oligomeric Golgi complex subunit 7 n=1 Tax=Synchytrium microbalum TaxID=1806994 RepID=A0A507C9J6_9FUNG|nr:uncharacterized protein SmJEL517_g02687 [Synchytrium microbalum]TPX34644.1 hypothetical protein SmJEL517_g02687 [Synchytrium microbalum]
MNGLPPISTSANAASGTSSVFIVALNHFAAPEFDLESWLNSMLSPVNASTPASASTTVANEDVDYIIDSDPTAPSSSSAATPSIDRLASGILSQLEQLSFELSTQLDTLSTTTINALPQVLHDLGQARKQSSVVSSLVRESKLAMSKRHQEDDTNVTFEHLTRVDTVKTRMEASKKMLKEAENWNTLPAEMEGIFAGKDHLTAATRLQEAQRSLVLLTGAPDYEDRKALLATLQNKLEAALSPQLVTALNDRDVDACKKLYRVFMQIQRTGDFATYYYKSRKGGVVKTWESTSRSDKLIEGLEAFYEEVDKVVTKEAQWLPYVFPHPLDTLQELIKDIFSSLDMKSRLSGLELPVIVQAYIVTVGYGFKLEKLLASVSPLGDTPSSPGRAVDSSQSLAAMFEPFLQIQQDYSIRESALLMSQLSATTSTFTKSRDVEIVQPAFDAIRPLVSHIEAAITRCRAFTFGFGVKGLVDAVNSYIERIASVYTNAVLKYLGGADSEWGQFQVGLRVLGICCTLLQRLSELEPGIRRIVALAESRRDTSSIDECASATSILRASTLNSLALQTLISSASNTILVQLTPIETLAKAAQKRAFDILITPIQKQLDVTPSLPVWNASAPTTSSPFGIEVPQFSLSPSSYATRMGEHLLALPQQIELYQDDEALRWNVKELPYLATEEIEEPEVEPAFLWMTCVVRAAASLFSTSILKIDKLSPHGCLQLKEDVGYMINVFAAMDVEPDATLVAVRKGVEGKELLKGEINYEKVKAVVDDENVSRWMTRALEPSSSQ